MNYFRKITNGPPCEIRQEDMNVLHFDSNNDTLDLSTENGLIDWTCSFSAAQKKSRSTKILIQNWMRYFQDMGITIFSYYHMCPNSEGHFKDSSVMAHFGLPKAWKKSYLVQGFSEDDPLMSYAFDRNELFKFSDLKHFTGRTPREVKYFDSLLMLDLSEGYALPIFNSGVCHGFFAMGIGKQHPAFNERQLEMLLWVCQIAHDRYLELMAKEKEQNEKLGSRAKLKRQKLAQHSDKEAVRKVISELKKGNIADEAQSKNESYLYQVAAAMQLGYREPFSNAQSKLNYALMKMTASKEVTEDAWKSYHMLRHMEES